MDWQSFRSFTTERLRLSPRPSFLFTGDLEDTAIERLVDRYRNTATLDVDVYEVGHHGSHNGTTEEVRDAMTPKIAVISVGHWDDGKLKKATKKRRPSRSRPTPTATRAARPSNCSRWPSPKLREPKLRLRDLKRRLRDPNGPLQAPKR